jgi:hypothetical protein
LPKRMRLAEVRCEPSAGVAIPFTGHFVRPCPEPEVPRDVGHTFMAATTSAVN